MPRWVCAAAVLFAAAIASAESLEGPVEESELVLAEALGEGKDLLLYVTRHGDGVACAFARGPRFNRMPYAVEADELRWEGDRIAGRARIVIPSDGFVPPDNRGLTLAVAVDAAARDGAVEGTYETTVEGQMRKGVLAGTYRRAAPPGVVRRLTLGCEGAVYRTSSEVGRKQRLGMVLAIKDGRAFSARLIPPGSLTDVAMVATVERCDVSLEGPRLSGTLVGHVRPHTGEKVMTYTYALDGWVIGGAAAGRLGVTEDGRAASDGRFAGTVREGSPDPANASFTLTLHGAVPRNFLNLYLVTRDGLCVGGFGATPAFNNATHSLDLTGLRLTGGCMRGRVGVTVHPDPWVPKDHKPVACAYAIDARLVDGEAIGTFSGTFGKTEVAGPVEGGLEGRRPVRAAAKVMLKLENALFGGNEWHNRAFLSLNVGEDGRIAEGRVSNNHTKLSGGVEGGRVDLVEDGLKVHVKATVDPGGGVTPGAYAFDVEGVMVGTVAAGRFATRGPAGQEKSGRFWASITPAGEE